MTRKLNHAVLALLLSSGWSACQGEHEGHDVSQALDAAQSPAASHEGHSTATAKAAPTPLPSGLSSVLLDDARRQQLGVRTERANLRSFERDVKVAGIVRVDETKQSHVHLKFEGFVEKVFVNFVGRSIRKGEPLLSIYSPDLLAAEAEMAQALTSLDRIREGDFAAMERTQGQALLDAARSRLRLLDVPSEEIERLEKTRTPSRTLTIRSPLSGTVLERNAVDGMRAMPDMTLFVIADLREVWVLADVFESDLSSIKVGQHAVLRFAGGATPDREGKVAFVPPTLDEVTRSAKVRIEVPNDDGGVRPGLFADVTIHVAGGERLAVSDAAVIDTGERRICFVEASPGRFEPREVKTGARAGGYVEILQGVLPGESVAVSAQFLLDAESQIRGASQPGGHGGH
jgi:Cu(I)/Ag(I) efflux system membrane fusion protein